MADKASLVAAGFDPTFIDKVIADFAADAPLVLQLLADFRTMGFGIAWIVDCVTLAGKAGVQLLSDLAALFGNPTPHPVVFAAKAHATAKVMKAGVGAHPFLDWLLANGPALLALLLQFLPKKPQPTP